MSAAAFQLRDVTKNYSFGDQTISVLKSLNLEIQRGEFVSIMGPSGSGKSTLMQLLGCLDLPTSGSLSVFGQDTSTLTDDALASLRGQALGFIFQSFFLLPNYDALSNVAMGMVYHRGSKGRERAKELLEQMGLGHRLHHKPATLSGGEKQRVAIARAISNNPDIILADEPTGALDQENGHRILDILSDFHAQGKTIILVTHDALVAQRAERVIEIIDGEVQFEHE